MFLLSTKNIKRSGRFLSSMIMPNMGIFIAWGITTAFFKPCGWIPNAKIERITFLLVNYLLPILIGFTGGELIGKRRGGIVGAISTIGIIASSSIPMLFGAMLAGPIGGFVMNFIDKKIKKYKVSGFEMLIQNFSIGLISVFFSIFSFFILGPLIVNLLNSCFFFIRLIVGFNLLPLVSIFIEPAKILFLNNVINHGIFSPFGIQEVMHSSKSIFFFIEANPGPGLGVLLAYFLISKKKTNRIVYSAMVIHFIGGVHEIYFPYVLKNLKLIISLILGSMSGIFLMHTFHGGLISPASPGSIISILAMTPKGMYLVNLMCIFFSFLISFLFSFITLKCDINNNILGSSNHINLDEKDNYIYKIRKSVIKKIKIKFNNRVKEVHSIAVACDAGMGSSAIGAGILKKKIKEKKIENLCVKNYSIDSIPKDIDLVITHESLTKRAKKKSPNSIHISLDSFLDQKFYEELLKVIKKYSEKNKQSLTIQPPAIVVENEDRKLLFKFNRDNIFLKQEAKNKQEAINFIGKELVKKGYVHNSYVDAMLEREKISPTWIGEFLAIPHGTIEAKKDILRTGIIFSQYPKGVQFGDKKEEIAKIVIGIAAKNNEHIEVVSTIINILDKPNIINNLVLTKKKEYVLSIFNSKS